MSRPLLAAVTPEGLRSNWPGQSRPAAIVVNREPVAANRLNNCADERRRSHDSDSADGRANEDRDPTRNIGTRSFLAIQEFLTWRRSCWCA